MAEDALRPREYFEVVLPALLQWKGDAATTLGVNVRFVVSGKDGGKWTVRLRPPVAGVVEGADWRADLAIKITSEEMCSILAGSFDARKAIAEGNIEITGDLSVLKRVAFIFQAGGSQTDLRAGTQQGSQQ